MKKILFTLALTFLSIGFGKAQDKFRKDYNLIAIFNPENETWSDWKHAEHTFVFNYNSNNDVVQYTPKGETITYRNLGKKTEGYAKENHYQFIDTLDEEGNLVHIQLFDDPKIGVKIIYGSVIVQFSQY